MQRIYIFSPRRNDLPCNDRTEEFEKKNIENRFLAGNYFIADERERERERELSYRSIDSLSFFFSYFRGERGNWCVKSRAPCTRIEKKDVKNCVKDEEDFAMRTLITIPRVTLRGLRMRPLPSLCSFLCRCSFVSSFFRALGKKYLPAREILLAHRCLSS